MPVISLYQSRGLGIHVEELDEQDDDNLLMQEKEVVEDEDDEEEEEDQNTCNVRAKLQLAMIYSLHLADAIVIASLQPQLYILLKDNKLCGSLNTTYWTGLVQSVFAVGSIAGVYWGWVGDRVGRRPIALLGLLGMCMSCIVMGFSTDALVCAIVRGIGGFLASSIRVMAWTMTGDVSRTKKARARNFSRMPLVALGGIIGPILQATLAHRFAKDSWLWERFPILSSQLACAGLILIIFGLNYVFLDETLPAAPANDDYNAEAQPLAYARRDSLAVFQPEKERYNVSTEEIDEDGPILFRRRRPVFYSEKPEPISLLQLIRAPSLISVLLSFAAFSLHSSTFDQLLPILGNSPSSKGGLGLPCSLLSFIVLIIGAISALITFFYFSKSVERIGLLKIYRICSCCFPIVYLATPLLTSLSQKSEFMAGISSISSILLKGIATDFAKTLVPILVLNTSPDPYSLSSIMGFLQASTVLRSLASISTDVAMTLSATTHDGEGAFFVNMILWGILTIIAVGGAVGAWWIKDKAVVGRDYRAEQLKWEVCYDYAEDGVGF